MEVMVVMVMVMMMMMMMMALMFFLLYICLAITKELLKNTKTCAILANLAGGRKSGLARTAMQPEDYEKDEMVYHCISAFDPHSLSTARIRHHAVAIF